MNKRDPRTGARYLFAAAMIGLLLSQAGHALAYWVHYGSASLSLQSNGVHSYFPTTFQLSGALVGLVLVIGLLLISAARLAIGRALNQTRQPGVSVGALFIVLAIIQVNVYVSQEVLEASAAGTAIDPHGYLVLAGWGLLGQLPLAVLAAFGLAWLSSPLIAAIRVFRSPFITADPGLPVAFSPIRLIQLRGVFELQNFLDQASPAVFRKRGPPLSSLVNF